MLSFFRLSVQCLLLSAPNHPSSGKLLEKGTKVSYQLPSRLPLLLIPRPFPLEVRAAGGFVKVNKRLSTPPANRLLSQREGFLSTSLPAPHGVQLLIANCFDLREKEKERERERKRGRGSRLGRVRGCRQTGTGVCLC